MRDHKNRFLHLCASKMRMEPLLFADTRHAVPAFRENAPEWAFKAMRKAERSKRKGVKENYLGIVIVGAIILAFNCSRVK